jgi:23S rRNA (uridine2552-2'-O)-methyltransferase
MVKRSKTSKQWLKEHFADAFVQRAQQEGWRSRAVYKLMEVHKKDQLLKPGMIVVDLGAAPGSWSQYATHVLKGQGRVIASDILPMDPLPDVTFVEGDFREADVLEKLITAMNGELADLVISDMAPNLSGNKTIDQPRSMYLCDLALDCAKQILKPGGSFLTKVFQGPGFPDYLQTLRADFAKVLTRNPEASRDRSRECYLLAKNFRG